MIIVRAKTATARVENNFEDEKADQAMEYHHQLKQDGWESVEWIHLPNLTYDEYIKRYMERLAHLVVE